MRRCERVSEVPGGTLRPPSDAAKPPTPAFPPERPGAPLMTVMQTLGAELEPFVAGLYDRHLATAKEWFPHELVPWGRGRDFGPDAPWDPEESPVPEAVRVALLVNLLTEDNLPYYYASLS